ncbi:potassium transport 2/3 [Artemisia annua]|uniref:Potassium transport 2/3 n=1 Tax=Artemisia annua TaxID=35608 RepID=A0A2U1KPP6_ARTAN|nr:potassium transport 2/3 [Artemisia annua]
MDASKADVYNRYISAVYWSITTMKIVGYCGLHAKSIAEKFFVVMHMVLNLGLTAYLIGNMTNLVVEGSCHTM